MANVRRPDVLLIGGGVAGLICLDRLTTAGFDAVLVERDALGTGQTVHSQGILHGGLKYLLEGRVESAFGHLPTRWSEAFESGHEMDLRSCLTVAKHVLAWSQGPWSPRILADFERDGRPHEVESPPTFLKGRVFALPEPVVDVMSLLALLRDRHRPRLVHGEARFPSTVAGCTPPIVIGDEVFAPRRVVLTAGVASEGLARQLGVRVAKRQLPLHMVVVRGSRLPDLWGHGVNDRGHPELTITTHGNGIWYVGGGLSELGVERSESDQIEAARVLLRDWLPDVDLEDAHFSTHRVVRAEPERAAEARFEPFVGGTNHIWVAWPIKLVLAPVLADRILARLHEAGIEASGAKEPPSSGDAVPPVAHPPWHV